MRPDICQWELEFTFLSKKTVNKFINQLMQEEVDYNFDVEYKFEDNYPVYVVSLYNMSWANNLVTVAKILEDLDHSFE